MHVKKIGRRSCRGVIVIVVLLFTTTVANKPTSFAIATTPQDCSSNDREEELIMDTEFPDGALPDHQMYEHPLVKRCVWFSFFLSFLVDYITNKFRAILTMI
jgi:hypothetical protein